MTRPDPVAGVGDPAAAAALLDAAPTSEVMIALVDAGVRAQLDVLASHLQGGSRTRVRAAVQIVRFTGGQAVLDPGEMTALASDLAALAEADRLEILNFLGGAPQQLGEGALADEAAVAPDDPAPSGFPGGQGGLAAAMASITPGPWLPPGGQPIPFYIGNEAHLAIAAAYAAAHPTHAVFSNFSPVAALLHRLRGLGVPVNPLLLTASQLALKPDITNLTLRHLYEIKPHTAEALARTLAALYAAAFLAAGVPIGLGPVGEPGTSGAVPAPGGYYVFWSPSPGAIVYQYRRPQRQRQRQTQPQTQGQPQADPDLIKRIRDFTGLTGTALIIYLIISEGSRLFPPRNLVPVP